MGLIYTGSVKNIHQSEPATERRFGRGYMNFEGDPFSIFDYGRMPWEISGKGEHLWRETKRFRDVLEKAGIPTHFTQEDMGKRKIGIRLARMLKYDEIKPGETEIYRIPIECVFSKVVTPVSSLHGRLRRGEADPKKYGLSRAPKEGEVVELPQIGTSYSTKIETTDVYKGLAEMAKLSGLVANEPERLDALTIVCAQELIDDAADVGLIIGDGKFEFIIGPGRNFSVADIGFSWDENRGIVYLPDGRYVDASKQFPRNVYTINGWKGQLKEAQKQYPNDKSKWPAPPEIDEKYKVICSALSGAWADAVTRKSGSDRVLIRAATKAADALDELKDRYKRDETGKAL